jgi:hypothetical protein
MATPATVELQAPPTRDNASEVGHWLEEYGEIATILPVITGLLVTTRLQLRGANALLANLAIAAIIRQIIIQLKKHASHTTTHFAVAGEVGAAVAAGSAVDTDYTDEDYTIVHSVPGRIRLHIPRLRSEAAYAKRLERLLLTEAMVLGVRINRAASSLVIRYNGADLTELELGTRLLHVLEQAEQT